MTLDWYCYIQYIKDNIFSKFQYSHPREKNSQYYFIYDTEYKILHIYNVDLVSRVNNFLYYVLINYLLQIYVQYIIASKLIYTKSNG
jgi:hypothetical protein